MLEEKTIKEIKTWIENYIPKEEQAHVTYSRPANSHAFGFIAINKVKEDLNKENETFSQVLMKYLIKKDIDNVRCYEDAYIRQETFSRIYNGRRNPTKKQVACLALSLHLNINEYDDFLKAASYARSRDINDPLNIVGWCIENNNYDLADAEEAVSKITKKHLFE